MDGVDSVFIAATYNNHIRKVDTNGIITTVADNGNMYSYSGDGGPATKAALSYPSGVAVDGSGNLFIADYSNLRIRKVTNTQGPTLALNEVSAANAGSYQVVVTGPGGSVTSRVANLLVVTSPLIYGTVVNPDGSVTLSCVSRPGSTNVVFCATDLSLPMSSWQPLSTNLATRNGNLQFTETNAASSADRFYRTLIR